MLNYKFLTIPFLASKKSLICCCIFCIGQRMDVVSHKDNKSVGKIAVSRIYVQYPMQNIPIIKQDKVTDYGMWSWPNDIS